MRTVPDEVLFAESARRMRARQKTPPRAEVLRPCSKCGEPYGARKLRAHIPGCTGKAVTNPNPNRMIRKITNLKDQAAENYRYWQSLPIGDRLAAVCEVTEAAYSLKKLAHNGLAVRGQVRRVSHSFDAAPGGLGAIQKLR